MSEQGSLPLVPVDHPSLFGDGLFCGARVRVWGERERTIVESVDGEAVSLPADVAAHIFCAVPGEG